MKRNSSSDLEPPDDLAGWIERYSRVSADEEPASLLAGAVRGLGEALRRAGGEREAAFALLAADGLITLVLERSADSADPRQAFSEVLEAVLSLSDEPTP